MNNVSEISAKRITLGGNFHSYFDSPLQSKDLKKKYVAMMIQIRGLLIFVIFGRLETKDPKY